MRRNERVELYYAVTLVFNELRMNNFPFNLPVGLQFPHGIFH